MAWMTARVAELVLDEGGVRVQPLFVGCSQTVSGSWRRRYVKAAAAAM
ncbi:hypothetical protein A7982_13991 [Minicystis rosea]|nr:hypothetical protein A7982_13991 [Minicystis rosea]